MIGMGKDGTAKPRGRGDRTPSALQWGGTGEKGGRERVQVPPADPTKTREGGGTSTAGCVTAAGNVFSRAEPNHGLRAEPVHPP